MIVSVIGILATIGIMSFSAYNRETREAQRSVSSQTFAEALESYYSKNGQYPSVRSVVSDYSDNNIESVSRLLELPSNGNLMPQSEAPLAVSTPAQAGDRDVLIYEAESATNNAACQTSPTGGCDRFRLSYRTEDNQEVVIDSRNSGSVVATNTTAPPKPSLSASEASPTTVTAESSVTICSIQGAPLTATYSFRHRVNSGSWTSWSAWTPSNTYTQTFSAGQLFDFEVMTRCDAADTPGVASVPSDPATFASAIATPAAPTMTVSNTATNVTGTLSVVSCPSGTTAQYGIRSRTNENTWGAYSAWSTTRTSTVTTAEGVRYQFQGQARCTNAGASSDAVESTVASYTRQYTAPAAPSISASTSGNVTTFTIGSVSCVSSGTTQYQNRSRTDAGSTTAWSGPHNSPPTPTVTTTNQGIQYSGDVQARCSNAYSTGPWSTIATASYIRPVANPGTTTFSGSRVNSHTIHLTANTTCGPGTFPDHRADIRTHDWSWSPFPPEKLGWYRDHFGSWVLNDMAWRGNPFTTGSVSASSAIPAGSRWNLAVEKRCRNQMTGRTSSTIYQASSNFAL